MHPTDRPQQDSVTFTIRRSTRNVFFAKLFILLGLTLGGGYLLVQSSGENYRRGRELTQEKHLEQFDQRKSFLLSRKDYYENPALSTFVMFLFAAFFLGSYELIALAIGFMIGKVMRR